MPPTLHIVVNCADRKLIPVLQSRRLRAIKNSDLKDRAKAWWKKLTAPPGQNVLAVDVYGGSYWTTVRKLPAAAESAGFRPKLWIISAGYGLLPGSAKVNAYSATFAASSPDSVIRGDGRGAPRSHRLQQWWETLSAFTLPNDQHPRTFDELLNRGRGDRYLVVASPDYLTAVLPDIGRASRHLTNPENLVIISSRPAPMGFGLDQHFAPCDARLQCFGDCPPPCRHIVPAGVRGVIGAGVACAVLRRVGEWGFGATPIRTHLEDLIGSSPELPRLNRRRMDDKEVCAFIEAELAADGLVSCAVLLRKLRDGGRACEQTRFKGLYWRTKRSLYEA